MSLADADQQRISDAQRQRAQDNKRTQDRGRLQRAIRTRPQVLPVLSHRGKPQSFAFVRACFQGERISYRESFRADRHRNEPRRNYACQYTRVIRAFARLRSYQDAPFPLRQVCRRQQQARYSDESYGRGNERRQNDRGKFAQSYPFARDRRISYVYAQIRYDEQRRTSALYLYRYG